MDGFRHYIEDDDLQNRGVRAVCRYLEMQGHEIVHEHFDSVVGGFDIVSRDDGGAIHFVDVRVRKFGLPVVSDVSEGMRRRYENRAIAYLDAHRDVTDVPLVFDVADVGVIGTDRAILRYQTSILSSTSDELRSSASMLAAEVPDDDDDVPFEIEPAVTSEDAD